MFKHLRLHRTDEGQGLVIVIAVVAIAAIMLGALEVSSISGTKLTVANQSSEQALQAAQTGLADYESNVNSSPSQWQYVMDYCSSGTFGCQIGTADANTPPGNAEEAIDPVGETAEAPDPQNAGFSGIPDPHCTTSAYNATAGTVGTASYFGWTSVHGSTTGGFSEQFQYVVDSTSATPLGGYAHIFVTGRAGTSGHYVCTTIKALYNGPQTTNVNTRPRWPAPISRASSSRPRAEAARPAVRLACRLAVASAVAARRWRRPTRRPTRRSST